MSRQATAYRRQSSLFINDRKEWQYVQKSTFTNWVNDKLRGSGCYVHDLESDFEDGVALIKLLEALAPDKKMPRKYTTKPKSVIEKTENLSTALQFIKNTERIPLVNIGPGDIKSHNLKLILGLIWTLILNYQTGIRKDLLEWINATLPDKKITNFGTDWNDGHNLSSLINYCKPGLISEHASLDPNNGLQNITHAMSLAEEHFGIPQVMHSEDLAMKKPDELSVMTYLSYFCALGSPGQNILKSWINKRVPNRDITNFSTDWTDGQVLGILVDHVSHGQFPNHKDAHTKESVENCQDAMHAAESLLGIKQTLTPQEFANPHLRELKRMAYLTQFIYVKVPPRITEIHAPPKPGLVWVDLKTDCKEVYGTVQGNMSDQIPVEVEHISEETYRFKFQAPTYGQYALSVYVDGEPIKGSPLPIAVSLPDPASITCSCVSVPKTLGNEIVLKLNASPDIANVKVRNGTGREIPALTQVTELGENECQVSVTPLEPDTYHIEMTVNDIPISNSPFTIDLTSVAQPEKVECKEVGNAMTFRPGRIVQVLVDTSRAGRGELRATCQGGKCGAVDTAIIDLRESEKSKITFTPPDYDQYILSVYYEGEEIKGSPFEFKIFPLPPNPSGIKIIQPPSATIDPGDKVAIVFDASDAGRGIMTAECRGDRVGEIPTSIKKADDSYTVTFTLPKQDTYLVSVLWSGQHIPESPFKFTITNPLPDPTSITYSCISAPKILGQEVVLKLNASPDILGLTAVKVRNGTGREVPALTQVTELGENECQVSVTPLEPDTYHIEMTVNDIPISNSPFTIDLTSVAQPEKVECKEVSNAMTFRPGRMVQVLVDTSRAGRGELRATCQGGKCGAVDTTIDLQESEKSKITFTPPDYDQYILSVYYEGEEIKGSPFEFKILPLPPNPSGIKIIQPPSAAIDPGDKVAIVFDASNAGRGIMTAECRGDRVGEISTSVIKADEEGDTYTLKFTPTEQDTYRISVLWSGHHIPGSPYKLALKPKHPPKPSKCRTVGLDELSFHVVKKDIRFQVDTADAGQGVLEATVTTPSLEKINIQIKRVSDQKGLYDLCYTPHSPGVHTFSILWSNQHISGSPISLNVVTTKTYAYGHPVTVDIKADTKRKYLQALALGPGKSEGRQNKLRTATQSRVTIKKVSTGHFQLSFLPQAPGLHELHVLSKGRHVPGSPFFFDCSNEVKPGACTVSGLAEVAAVGEELKIVVDTSNAGEGDLYICRRSSSDSASVGGDRYPLDIICNEDGTFSAHYVPDQVGQQDIDVLFAGSPVPGSPFRVAVLKDKKKRRTHFDEDDEIVGLDLENERFAIGVPHKFTLHCEALGDGIPDISCKPTTAASISISPAPGENSYYCTIVPLQMGKHVIFVEFEDKHVLGSPFNVKFDPQGNAGNCKMIETHPECSQGAGDDVVICISTRGAGRGRLTAKLESLSTKASLPVSVTHPYKYHYNLQFSPTHGLDYELTVRYDETHILGSPFKIELGNAALCNAEGEGLKTAQKDKWSRFSVWANNAGAGELKVTVEGEGGATINPNIIVTNGRYDVAYLPPRGGTYMIYILWGSDSIPGSPFEVTCVDPAELQITDRISQVCIGRPIKFMVLSDIEPQEDKLEVFARRNHTKTHGQAVRVDDLMYECTVKLLEVGKYTVHARWGKVAIKGSPFKVEVIDTFSPKQFKVNVNELDGGTIGVQVLGPKQAFQYGELTASVQNASTQETVPVTVTQLSGEECKLDFYPNPSKGSRYFMSIVYDGVHIHGSPFHLIATDASQCKTLGKGLQRARVGSWNKFSVFTENAGPGDLKVNIEREGGGSLDPQIALPYDTHFEVRYLPEERGLYIISVVWGGKQVTGSPFKVHCCSPEVYSITSYPKLSMLGKEVELQVTAAAQSMDWEHLTITAKSKAGKEVSGSITETSSGKYTAAVDFPDPGKYKVHIYCNSFEIKNSPVTLKVLDPPDAAKVTAYGPGLMDGFIGEEVSFTIDASEGGDGYINLQVQGPKGFNINMNHGPPDKNIVLAQYNPTHSGKYLIHILWSGEHIPGSPFAVHFQDINSHVHKA